MTELAERLKAQLSRLSAPERAEIARFLLQSLDDGVDDDVESAWDTELERRMEEIRLGTASGEPAASVFARLRERYS